MTISERGVGNVTIVRLQGDLVFRDGEAAFRRRVNDFIDEADPNVIVNLHDVT